MTDYCLLKQQLKFESTHMILPPVFYMVGRHLTELYIKGYVRHLTEYLIPGVGQMWLNRFTHLFSANISRVNSCETGSHAYPYDTSTRITSTLSLHKSEKSMADYA